MWAAVRGRVATTAVCGGELMATGWGSPSRALLQLLGTHSYLDVGGFFFDLVMGRGGGVERVSLSARPAFSSPSSHLPYTHSPLCAVGTEKTMSPVLPSETLRGSTVGCRISPDETPPPPNSIAVTYPSLRCSQFLLFALGTQQT